MKGLETQKLNIIIVGAGIAGLAAALGLHQKGHSVTVFERHADVQSVGGPINMSPSATQILTEYGLKEIIHQHLNVQEFPTHFRRYQDGSNLADIPVGALTDAYGST
jgi:salicylate hydroxylase